MNTEFVSTSRFTWVTITVPEDLDDDVSEDDYEAVNDALGPWGGRKAAIEIERLDPTTIVAMFENHH